jgi:hypothetical protein
MGHRAQEGPPQKRGPNIAPAHRPAGRRAAWERRLVPGIRLAGRAAWERRLVPGIRLAGRAAWERRLVPGIRSAARAGRQRPLLPAGSLTRRPPAPSGAAEPV